MRKKVTKKLELSWEQRTLLGMVAGASVAIMISFLGFLVDTPAEMAHKELAELADDYYISYLYPTLLGDVFTVDPGEKLQGYVELGTPATYLRQLLHYDNDKNMLSAPIFENVACDTNRTSIKFFPVEPYGPRDYTIKYTWNCDGMPKDE